MWPKPYDGVRNAVTAEYCSRAKTEAFTNEELRPLTRWENLGCRNPVGLDHVLVSETLAPDATAERVPLGKFGGTRLASDRFPDTLLAVSDHCPVKVRRSFRGVRAIAMKVAERRIAHIY